MPHGYSELLERIQAEIPLNEINKDNLTKYLKGRIGERGGLINEFLIAFSIARTENFARKKGIKLSDKIRGNEYAKWGRYKRQAVVIRNEKGRIITWGYIK